MLALTYTGFIYILELYIPTTSIESILSTTCDSCPYCPGSGTCISSCAVSAVYSATTQKCISCPSVCPTSCLNSTTCGLCADSFCTACTSFSPSSCIACQSGYVLQNSICVACPATSFFDASTTACIACSGLCLGCTSPASCTSCIQNSSLQPDNTCACDQGYTTNGYRVRSKLLQCHPAGIPKQLDAAGVLRAPAECTGC